jgi:benzoyl-CoA reductase/2-hydroxyglutaryl-CoA dehydratase subunit BcrC/BadD/HgdB
MSSECCSSAGAGSCCSGGSSSASSCPITYFEGMIGNCLEYATAAKKSGKPIVGIMCEYTPRELIMAAGALPVCLCGGSADTIPAAEESLPTNLCPLIKSTFGYHAANSNPFLAMADLIVGETTCDGKKKMYELMGMARKMHILELPHRQDCPEALAYWRAELVRLKDALNRRFNVNISDNCIRHAIEVMNRERSAKRKLAALMESDNPPITGLQLLGLKSIISGIPSDLEQYDRAIGMFSSMQGAAKKSVRVLLTGVPTVHGAERVVNIIETSGGLVVCTENCTGLKPVLDDVDTSGDPIDALARKYFGLHCSVMTPNARRRDTMASLVKQYRPQCIVDLVWQACLTYDVESYFIRDLAKELNLPYLRIETDYSPSDSARIKVRLQAMFETVRSRNQRC